MKDAPARLSVVLILVTILLGSFEQLLASSFDSVPPDITNAPRTIIDGREFAIIGDMLFPIGLVTAQSAGTGNRWPNGIVYYIFESGISDVDRATWRAAAAEWSAAAAVSFIEGTGAGNFVQIHDARQDTRQNRSTIGMVGGRQMMSINDWDAEFIIAHEIAHSLGMIHEQSRPDRDAYVTVFLQNVIPEDVSQFQRWDTTGEKSTNYGPYDFDSVMHYPRYAFSINGQDTIQPVPQYSAYINVIGQRTHLSDLDKAGMARRYGAAPGQPRSETISNPVRPVGFASSLKGTSVMFTTGGAVSSLGHAVQYQFDWGDGELSPWLPPGTTSASHSWSSKGTFSVTAQARCALDNAILSAYSPPATHTSFIALPNGTRYDAVELPVGGGAQAAFAINNLGQVVVQTSQGNVLYSNGSITPIALNGSAADINDWGLIAGSAGPSAFNSGGSFSNHAFLYSAGWMLDLGTFGGVDSGAGGINNRGEVVGSADVTQQIVHAFVYSEGTMHDLGTLGGARSWGSGINDSGQVVGISDVNLFEQHGFLYSNGVMSDLGTFTPNAINNLGQVAGVSGGHAFLYSGNSMLDLGTLGGLSSLLGSSASDINDLGQVVGRSAVAGLNSLRAFLYTNGNMYDLNDLYIRSDVLWFNDAYRINNHGQILAQGLVSGNDYETFLLTPVGPRPANDVFANPSPLYGSAGKATASNVGATKETGEPLIDFNPGGASVWYTWTALATAPISFDTAGSNFSTMLAVYTGNTLEQLTLVASNDDRAGDSRQSSITFTASAGTTYKIAVDGLNAPTGTAASGTIILNWCQSNVSNISTRLSVQTNGKVGIAGFIIKGTSSKQVLIRALGPELANYGVPGTLQQPLLELHASNSVIANNDGWMHAANAMQIPAGLRPKDVREPAILITLEPGGYTAVVSGLNGTTGNALVEVYDLESSSSSLLADVSTRGFVGTGDSVMIGGFISGAAGSSVVIRAIGPTLRQTGVANPLEDPVLTLFDGNGTQIATNDDWKQTQQAEITAANLAPPDDREPAILFRCPPGNSTAIVRGKNGATGVALVQVELFNLP